MAKPLDPKKIEAVRQTNSRAERREQKRKQMQDEIAANQRSNGVIIIPPQKPREMQEEQPKLRVAAYCRVSTQEEGYLKSGVVFGEIFQIHKKENSVAASPNNELMIFQ